MSKVELLMVRDRGALRPYGDVAWETFGDIRTSRPVVVTVHKARNPDHHRKFWALATRVAENDPAFEDAEDAAEWVKMQIPGMRKEYVLRDGRLAIRTKSISFQSMDQLKFNRFYDRALYLWSERLGIDAETLLNEAEDAEPRAGEAA